MKNELPGVSIELLDESQKVDASTLTIFFEPIKRNTNDTDDKKEEK